MTVALFAGMVVITAGLWRATPGSLVPEFEEVNGAAAYHTLKGLQDFRTGTCYVVLAAESKPKGATIEVTAPERAFLRKHGVIAPEPAGLF